MALNATICKAVLQVSDMPQLYYAEHALTIARHPSETDERMMVRLLAFALNAHEHLAFGKGLSDTDEPDLWQKDLTGAIAHWIDVGQPDEKRMLRACGRANRVTVCAYRSGAQLWWTPIADRLTRATNLAVWRIPASASHILGKLAARNMQLQCTVQDGRVWFSDGAETAQIEPVASENSRSSRGTATTPEEGEHVMLTPEAIDAAARDCFEMHRTRTRYRPLDAALRAAPLDDAYRIQDSLHRLLVEAGRGDIAGWKIALTSKAMQQMTGVDQPAAGAVFSTTVLPSPARINLGTYHHLGVEFEVAVRLGDDLPASGGPWTRASVAGRVAACLAAFELVEDGAADYKALEAFTLVAQNTWNGGVVLGAPVTAWRGLDLEGGITRCWINDQPAGQGKVGDALGHPFEAVAWLADLLNHRGRMLARRMIVMTGSSITTKFPGPGDRVRFAIDGLGEVALDVAR